MSNTKCKIVICDNVRPEMGPNGVINNIVNVLQCIEPVNIPSNYTFTAACFFSDVDKNIDHVFSIKLIDPNGKLVINFDKIKLEMPSTEQVIPQNSLNLQINAEFRNSIIRYIGTYHIQVYDNNEKIAEDTIEVKKSDGIA